MGQNEWRYYNHAVVSALPPHRTPDTGILQHKVFWKSFPKQAFFASWTTDYDCAEQTEWWYCICDRPFDLQALKSKRRNVVKNALKYCTVSIGNPLNYEEELFVLYNEAQNSYPAANRNTVDADGFHHYLENLSADKSLEIFICFLKDTGAAAGYAVIKREDEYCGFLAQKTKPEFEKYQVSAALVYAVLEQYRSKLESGYYICDGSRNINHVTGFQSYLEKYFGFRKAYCRLHMKYKAYVHLAVCLLYPFRKALTHLDSKAVFHNINGVLKMEEIRRLCHE